MALNRIDGFSTGLNAYNIPSATDKSLINPSEEELDLKKQEQAPEKEEKPSLDLTVDVPERGNASIENIAISFGQTDASSLDFYSDMGIASLDMKQAISGMKKDEILHEYQYFVGKDMTGKQSNIVTDTEDGMVVRLH